MAIAYTTVQKRHRHTDLGHQSFLAQYCEILVDGDEAVSSRILLLVLQVLCFILIVI